MNTLVYLILQVLNGEKWNPEFGVSKNYKNWIAVLDTKTCLVCRFNHGKIWLIIETPNPKPPVHYNCRCEVKKMITVKAGTATISKYDGADWWLKTNDELPSVYISYLDAKKQGWNPLLGDLHSKCPNKLITNGVYKNRNGHLPNKKTGYGMRQI